MPFKGKSKKEIRLAVYHYFLCVLGSVLLALGTSLFLSKNLIVSGGLSGIAFIVQHYFGGTQVIDIVVWILTGLLWFLSLFFLGRKFALSTLIASIVYPLCLTLFLRIPFFDQIATSIAGDGKTGDLLLCAIFGGVVNGFGIALTFIGKGSTGGLDVLCFMANKYLGAKVSVTSFVLDAAIIAVGIFALDFPNYLTNCLCGIICAVFIAWLIEMVYTKKQNAFIMDAISDKWEEIVDYITDELSRSATLIEVQGAYSRKGKIMVRSVLSNSEYIQIKDFIANLDPNAFVTFTNTNAVFGEGFQANTNKVKKLKEKLKNRK